MINNNGGVRVSLPKANAFDISMVIHPHTQSTLFVRGALWVRVRTVAAAKPQSRMG